MTCRIEFRPAALRGLKALSADVRRRIKPKIDALADNPRPPGVEKLSGHERRYRMRVGDYRIIYSIEDQVLLVLIIRLGHRREVYRGL